MPFDLTEHDDAQDNNEIARTQSPSNSEASSQKARRRVRSPSPEFKQKIYFVVATKNNSICALAADINYKLYNDDESDEDRNEYDIVFLKFFLICFAIDENQVFVETKRIEIDYNTETNGETASGDVICSMKCQSSKENPNLLFILFINPGLRDENADFYSLYLVDICLSTFIFKLTEQNNSNGEVGCMPYAYSPISNVFIKLRTGFPSEYIEVYCDQLKTKISSRVIPILNNSKRSGVFGWELDENDQYFYLVQSATIIVYDFKLLLRKYEQNKSVNPILKFIDCSFEYLFEHTYFASTFFYGRVNILFYGHFIAFEFYDGLLIIKKKDIENDAATHDVQGTSVVEGLTLFDRTGVVYEGLTLFNRTSVVEGLTLFNRTSVVYEDENMFGFCFRDGETYKKYSKLANKIRVLIRDFDYRQILCKRNDIVQERSENNIFLSYAPSADWAPLITLLGYAPIQSANSTADGLTHSHSRTIEGQMRSRRVKVNFNKQITSAVYESAASYYIEPSVFEDVFKTSQQ